MSCAFNVSVNSGAESFRYSGLNNDVIGRSLYWRGLRAWEPETIKTFIDLIRGAKVFLDVGANTGIYSLIGLAINPKLQVIAFEPVPRIRRRLEENIRLNGWQDRCEVRAEAVSGSPGVAQFHIPYEECPTSASLNESGFRGFEGEVIAVPVTTLDEVCGELFALDVVKIDVEGFEDKALEGMKRILNRFAPDLLLECNPDGPMSQVQARLKELGYAFFHLTGSGAQLRPGLEPDPSERFRNYLCTKKNVWTEKSLEARAIMSCHRK